MSPSASASVRSALLSARDRGHCALVPYLTLGYPTLDASLALLEAMEDLGVDVVEVGIPFSDPVADGPTIQHTIDVALGQGVTLRRALDALAANAPHPSRPRVLFSYYNPLLAYGLENLPAALAKASVRGTLVTDLIPEEAAEWMGVMDGAGLETCFLVAATSSPERLDLAATHSRGFVYCISTLGVTGSRAALDPTAGETVRRLRARHDVPVAVGFGISKPADVQQVKAFADGVVVGSALLDALKGVDAPADVARRGVEFLEPLLNAARS